MVIAGKKGWFYEHIFTAVNRLGLQDRVVFTGFIDETMKQSLLAHAFAFVYPSFYEGFGLPILEAMSCGVPVITGNASSLPEVAGDAALLVNPGKTQEISTAMLKLLTDQDLYNTLVQKSLDRVKQFSWQTMAQKTLDLLKSCGPR